MIVGIAREIAPDERRVAAAPATVEKLLDLGFDEVRVETGAGDDAGYTNRAYRAAGAEIVYRDDLWDESDVVLKVRPPMEDSSVDMHEADRLRDGATLISFIWPAQNEALLERWTGRDVNVIGMDQVPRITRAQKLDALSSMANIAGYRAVVEASHAFGRFFMGQVTAAGKLAPAKVLVIGAGVAGLAAIGAARSLGAIVRAFDTRPEVKEQVESMGAEFLELDFEESGSGAGGYAKVMSKEFIEAEMALFAEQAREVDIIITTALIPGKPAPRLIDASMVESMRPGSVIVDLAAEQGGNCELTEPGEAIESEHGVKIIGYTDMPSRMASLASELYGNNLAHMLDELGGGESYDIDLDNDVIRGALIVHEGEITWPPPEIEPSPTAPVEDDAAPTPKPAPPPVAEEDEEAGPSTGSAIALGIAGLLLLGIGIGAPTSFLTHFTVFVLACFVGWQVIWNVTPALHTPLMSVTNAISGIIIIAGMLQVSGTPTSAATILGAIAILIATINISGGFLVTQRMLKMFHR